MEVKSRELQSKDTVLLLDEATSALDSVSENQIQMVLDTFMENRTVMTIAHRMGAVEKMDINIHNIVAVLDHGHVIGCGTYPELASKKGSVFSCMLKLQEK